MLFISTEILTDCGPGVNASFSVNEKNKKNVDLKGSYLRAKRLLFRKTNIFLVVIYLQVIYPQARPISSTGMKKAEISQTNIKLYQKMRS